MRAAGLPHVHETLAHRPIGKDIDVERRHFGAQDRIVELACRILAERLGKGAADADHVAARAAARDHLAFVAEQIFGDVPAAVDFANKLRLRHFDIVEEGFAERSEEHTSALQSLMRLSYAVFCLKKKKQNT